MTDVQNEREVAEAVAELGLVQRRKLGLTFANTLQAASKLKKANKLSKDSDVAAAQIAEELALQSPKAFAEAALDWDKILKFIETILPLILKLLALFGI